MANRKLTDKQQAFINEYLKCWNATQAAINAGYSENSARAIGAENLSKPDVAAEIQARISEHVMSANESLVAMSQIARADISEYIDVRNGVPIIDFDKAKENGTLNLVKKISYGKGTISFELYDRQRAIETFMKHYGLLSERLQIDVNVVIETVNALRDAGLNPTEVFNDMIAEAHALKAVRATHTETDAR